MLILHDGNEINNRFLMFWSTPFVLGLKLRDCVIHCVYYENNVINYRYLAVLYPYFVSASTPMVTYKHIHPSPSTLFTFNDNVIGYNYLHQQPSSLPLSPSSFSYRRQLLQLMMTLMRDLKTIQIILLYPLSPKMKVFIFNITIESQHFHF